VERLTPIPIAGRCLLMLDKALLDPSSYSAMDNIA
jgi:hypothetical protein